MLHPLVLLWLCVFSMMKSSTAMIAAGSTSKSQAKKQEAKHAAKLASRSQTRSPTTGRQLVEPVPAVFWPRSSSRSHLECPSGHHALLGYPSCSGIGCRVSILHHNVRGRTDVINEALTTSSVNSKAFQGSGRVLLNSSAREPLNKSSSSLKGTRI